VRCAYPGYKRNVKMGSSFRGNDGDWFDGVTAWGPVFSGMTALSVAMRFSPSPTGRGVGVRVGACDHARIRDARFRSPGKGSAPRHGATHIP